MSDTLVITNIDGYLIQIAVAQTHTAYCTALTHFLEYMRFHRGFLERHPSFRDTLYHKLVQLENDTSMLQLAPLLQEVQRMALDPTG